MVLSQQYPKFVAVLSDAAAGGGTADFFLECALYIGNYLWSVRVNMATHSRVDFKTGPTIAG